MIKWDYVSVSLRSIIHSYNKKHLDECLDAVFIVSVSLRSIIHSYLLSINMVIKNTAMKFPSPYGVSFILILKVSCWITARNLISFRLLTEYHSFLYGEYEYLIEHFIEKVSVSLRSIIHSYLLSFAYH